MSKVKLRPTASYRAATPPHERMTIRQDEVEIDVSATEGAGAVMVVVIPLIVSGEPDLTLQWARLEGETFLYWRETYQHRRYRQGLLKIAGREFEPWCEGQGGSEPQRHWGEVYILRPN